MTTKLLCEIHGIIDEYENVEEQKVEEDMNRFNADDEKGTENQDGEEG